MEMRLPWSSSPTHHSLNTSPADCRQDLKQASLQGYAKLPSTSVSTGVVSLGGDAELRLASESSLVGNLKLKMGIKTPRIQTAGQASSHAVWQLDRDEQALVGDQTLVQTVIAATNVERIECRTTGFIVVDRWFHEPVRLEATPVHSYVDLAKDGLA